VEVSFTLVGFQSYIGNEIFFGKRFLDILHAVQHKFTRSFGFSCLGDAGSKRSVNLVVESATNARMVASTIQNIPYARIST